MSTRSTVLITEPIGKTGLEILSAACRCLMPWEVGSAAAGSAVRELLREADAAVVRLFAVRAADFEAAPRLRVVAKHGVGTDNIDLEAATRAGVPVLATPGANANAVAEQALALMLALVRHVPRADGALRRGEPARREDFAATELAGKTLGIIGLGRIGERVARKAARGLEMMVLAHDPYVPRGDRGFAVTFCDTLEDLLRDADFVSLHVPLTSETRRMIDARRLACMRPTARLVNTSRGAVVDEEALARALAEGRIAGAALDVFEVEPLPAGHRLLAAPNTVLSPHIAGMTAEALEEVSRTAACGVLAVLEGRWPAELVANPEVRETRQRAGRR